MQDGHIDVIEDPPPNKQKGKRTLFLVWNPDFHGSISTNNGRGEIAVDEICVPYLTYNLFKILYGNKIRRYLLELLYDEDNSDLWYAMNYIEDGVDFPKKIWEAEEDSMAIELNKKNLGMKNLIETFRSKKLHQGEYLGMVPGSLSNNQIHISKNEKGIYVAQEIYEKPFDGLYDTELSERPYAEPNIVELYKDETEYVANRISELDGYKRYKKVMRDMERIDL